MVKCVTALQKCRAINRGILADVPFLFVTKSPHINPNPKSISTGNFPKSKKMDFLGGEPLKSLIFEL